MQGTAFARLIGLAVVPIGQTVDYDYAAVPLALKLVACGAVGVLGSCGAAMRKTAPLISLGIAWTLIASIPRFLVTTPLSVFNEHQFYVPMMGGVFIVADLLNRFGSVHADPLFQKA